jgi:alkylated DNA repair dioxygenase AlkB
MQQMNLFADQTGQDEVVPQINGLVYRPAFLSREDQEVVLAAVDAQPWQHDLKRRVQHYGYRYDYKARRVDLTMRVGELPEFAVPVARILVEGGLMSVMPDQLIVNEYLPGQGITAHVDCEPCFGPRIAMVSLGWAYEMDFIHAQTRALEIILLKVGSALGITEEARYQWLHQIKARKSDRGVPRKRRVSLTFRNVILSI